MTRKTIVELIAGVAASFPDNSVGAITPLLLRTFLNNFLDTMRPSYGAASLTSLTVGLTATDAGFAWGTVVAAQAPDYTVALATGIITRAGGPASATVQFSIDVVSPNNTITVFTLYIDGVATPWAVSNTSTNTSDVQSYAMSALNYSANANPTYQIRARTNGVNTVTLSNGVVVVQNVPVNTN